LTLRLERSNSSGREPGGANTIDGVYKCTLGHSNDQREGFVTAFRAS
jgi:hypothetical protein